MEASVWVWALEDFTGKIDDKIYQYSRYCMAGKLYNLAIKKRSWFKKKIRKMHIY